MAEPARASADGPGPEHPAAAVLDPRKLIWADVRSALAVQIEAVALAVADLAAHPGSGEALEMARLCLSVLERLGEMGRQWTVDEAVLAEQRQRGFDEGVEWYKAQRCRLQPVPGPH